MDQDRGTRLYATLAFWGLCLVALLVLLSRMMVSPSADKWLWSRDAGEPINQQSQPSLSQNEDGQNRRMLRERERVIDQLRSRIDRISRDHERLQKEYDDLAAMVRADGRLVIESNNPSEPTDVLAGEFDTEPDGSLTPVPLVTSEAPQNAVENLQAELEMALMLLDAREREVEQLREQRQELERQKQADDALMRAALEQERLRRQAASAVIARIGGVAVPVLMDILNDTEPQVREWAADMLGLLGPTARNAAPTLEQALRDPDRFVREAARAALATVRQTETRDPRPEVPDVENRPEPQ